MEQTGAVDGLGGPVEKFTSLWTSLDRKESLVQFGMRFLAKKKSAAQGTRSRARVCSTDPLAAGTQMQQTGVDDDVCSGNVVSLGSAGAVDGRAPCVSLNSNPR